MLTHAQRFELPALEAHGYGVYAPPRLQDGRSLWRLSLLGLTSCPRRQREVQCVLHGRICQPHVVQVRREPHALQLDYRVERRFEGLGWARRGLAGLGASCGGGGGPAMPRHASPCPAVPRRGLAGLFSTLRSLFAHPREQSLLWRVIGEHVLAVVPQGEPNASNQREASFHNKLADLASSPNEIARGTGAENVAERLGISPSKQLALHMPSR